MTLDDRVKALNIIFYDLQETSSLNMKRAIVDQIPYELKEDFEFILECLAGKHVFGYSWPNGLSNDYCPEGILQFTVKDALVHLLTPRNTHDLSLFNIMNYCKVFGPWQEFFASIVDRTLKLGIGKSLLPKDGLSVMLAKKYEGKIKDDKVGYFITEKLDGNRCVAHFDGIKWVFTSRNGKPMHVEFDMAGLPKEYVYDGEILSPQQVKLSNAIFDNIYFGKPIEKIKTSFNQTSGLINRHDKNKELVYNIFDIMYDDASYIDRRNVLTSIPARNLSNNVRILPVLTYTEKDKLFDHANQLMDVVVKAGGEGVMINLASAKYQHKRTDGLLKFKPVYSMDMKVVDIEYGKGKYELCVGALICEAIFEGKCIRCRVGTGLSDDQRNLWADYPDEIIGRIVEIGYFAISQDSENFGTNTYSLRFPRFVKIRTDKDNVSVY